MWRRLRLWLCDNYLRKKGFRKLQEAQAEEHHKLVKEIRQRKRSMSTDLADIVLRLDAASDQLEQSLDDMEKSE